MGENPRNRRRGALFCCCCSGLITLETLSLISTLEAFAPGADLTLLTPWHDDSGQAQRAPVWAVQGMPAPRPPHTLTQTRRDKGLFLPPYATALGRGLTLGSLADEHWTLYVCVTRFLPASQSTFTYPVSLVFSPAFLQASFKDHGTVFSTFNVHLSHPIYVYVYI